MKYEKYHEIEDPAGKRLYILQVLLGHSTQKAFADQLGISASRLSNYYNGLNITQAIEARLRILVPGFNPSWLRYDDRSVLSVALAGRIAEIEAELEEDAKAV